MNNRRTAPSSNGFVSDAITTCTRPRLLLIAAVGIPVLTMAISASSASAQPRGPRVTATAWGGWFTDMRGFSDGNLDAFYRLDTAPAFGGGIHFAIVPGIQVGADGLYSSLSYQRFEQSTGNEEGEGDAKAGSLVASARLTAGGGGRLSLYLSAGAGIFAWDLDDPDLEEGWDIDRTLLFGIGLEYVLIQHAELFAEWGQFWVYHQKDEDVSRNTANVQLLRAGARLRL